MLVPPEVRDCVAFLGYRDSSGSEILCGTGFFVGSPLDDLGHRGKLAAFFVTAQHVVDGIKNKGGGRGIIRMNTTGGGVSWVDCPADEFMSHPSHPDQGSVDVAIACAGSGAGFDLKVLPVKMFATDEVIAKERIGIGDEVFVTGLFLNHSGKQRNLPIIRVGNIAAMPEEPVATKHYGDIDAYLVEARSIGGLSGSPVFVHIGAANLVGGQVRTGSFYLIGVMHGHWDSDGPLDVDEVPTEDTQQRERVNMGIAIVSPVQKLAEILATPKAQEHRRLMAARATEWEKTLLPALEAGASNGLLSQDPTAETGRIRSRSRRTR